MSIALCNGHIIDPSQKLDRKATIVIENGVVSEVTQRKSFPDHVQVVDVDGAVIAPGLVDAHCHLRQPGQGSKEDMITGSRAAAAGGFTSVACMANTSPVNDTALITSWIREEAKKASVRIYPIGAATREQKGATLADMGQMKTAGIVAVSDDGMCIMDAQVMRSVLSYAKRFNLPVIVHAEDSCLCGKGVMHEGSVSTQLGLAGKPAESEEVIVLRDIALNRSIGADLHIAHVSSAETVQAIRRAKSEGHKITAEVTPHHLTLTDQSLADYNVMAKVNPPIRDEAHRKALLKGIVDGTIDMIATDHAPHSLLDKSGGMDAAACGMIGFETAFSLCLMLVHSGLITLSKLIHLMSCAPAQFLNLPGGTLKTGSPADMVIFDPTLPWVVDSREFLSKSQNSPFDGWKLRGRVLKTIVGGRPVV